MHSVFAFVRQDFLSESSYRLKMILSVAGVAFSIIPVFFVARGLQPVMEGPIQGEGSDYFMFVLVGIITFRLIERSVTSLPTAINTGIRSGTLEALLSTPAPVRALIAGMFGYRVLWVAAEVVVLSITGWLLSGQLMGSSPLAGLAVLVLILLAHIPFGLLAGALELAFRTSARLPTLVILGSGLLGGVYYPTRVIPNGVESLSNIVPLAYGLRALRGITLEGVPLSGVAGDLLVLVALTALLFAASAFAFDKALKYSRQMGTLAQY